MLEVSLLGPLDVRRDGEVLRIPGGKTAEVLVRLALDAGTVVRTDRLVEELWADDAVNTRRNTLQSKVAKLRRALGEPSVVLSRDDGYLLDIEASDIDVHAVLSDATAASRLLDEGDDRGAATLAASALARFGADLIPSTTGEWVASHRARLESTHATLLEVGLTARVRLGETTDVIG
ncbi:MAG TPA: winged helix-turn-helix domain-containing protein, partial [Acidimicrobiales bacterium]